MRQKILAAVFIGAFAIFSPVQAMDQDELSSEEQDLGFDLPWMTFSILATVGIFVGESYAEELGDIISSLPSLEISSQTADQFCYAFILAMLEP